MRLWGIRVLIFDEDPELLHQLGDVLRREGGALIGVTGAHQALASIIGVSPDVVVVAVDRPALDASRLMRLLRTLSPEKGGRIPAVSLSALPALQDSWRGRCDAASFQGHLVRPVDAEELVTLVSDLAGRWVERRHAQRRRREWPDGVRVERRREVRSPAPTDGECFAAIMGMMRRDGRRRMTGMD